MWMRLDPNPFGSGQDLRTAKRVTFRVKPDRIDEFLSVFRGDVHARLRGQKGVRRIYLFRNPEVDNEFLSLTLWNDAPDQENSTQQNFSSNFGLLADVLETPPTFADFNVVHHEVNDSLPLPKKAVRRARRVARKSSFSRKAKSKRRKSKSRRARS
jgi:heme-degrading monooxygenase HmoA